METNSQKNELRILPKEEAMRDHVLPIPKHKRIEDPKFLKWVREHLGICCICNKRPAVEPHHYGEDACMGRKGSDHVVCEVCRKCHGKIQGKRRLAFERAGQLETLCDMQANTIALLSAYMEDGRRGR